MIYPSSHALSPTRCFETCFTDCSYDKLQNCITFTFFFFCKWKQTWNLNCINLINFIFTVGYLFLWAMNNSPKNQIICVAANFRQWHLTSLIFNTMV